MADSDLLLLILLTGAAWMFAAWVAYDTGYDKGWWDGRYPEHNDGSTPNSGSASSNLGEAP